MQIMMLTGHSLIAALPEKASDEADGPPSIELNSKLHRGSQLIRNPANFWRYWDGFYQASTATKPGAFHQLVNRLAKLSDRFLEVTQDTIGLSEAAGLRSDQLLQLHGSLHKYICMKCGAETQYPAAWGAGDGPRCEHMNKQCKGLIRPQVILLGENLSHSKLNQASEFLLMGTNLLVVAGTCVDFEYQGYLICSAVKAGIPVLFADPSASPFAGTLLNADFEVNLVEGIVPIQRPADRVLRTLVDHLDRCVDRNIKSPDVLWDLVRAVKVEVELQ